jgi:uncharacterized membrane protein YoaT (DUF817 family)
MPSETMSKFLKDFWHFGLKEARSCVFAGAFFLLLFLSHKIYLFGFYRYDFLLVAAILIQVLLLSVKLESLDELKAIAIFHIIGFCLEVFKTHPAVGSWSYPEPGYFKIFGVPLYSGFMYSAVASYIIQAWRLLKLRVTDHPPQWIVWVLAIAIYINFFMHHFFLDLRWLYVFVLCLIFRKSDVYFTPDKEEYKMSLLLSFVLIGFFIWFAENIATFLGAWKYPDQTAAWSKVHIGKWSSWSLLVIMTFIIVTNLKLIKASIVYNDSRVPAIPPAPEV